MKLRYILGRAGTGKTDLVFKEIKSKAKKNINNRYILLVPEQFTLQTEYDFITKTGLKGIINVEVLSFKRLAYKIFNETGGLNRVDIDEHGKIMILKKLFEEYSDELLVYKRASRKEGFLLNFTNLITQFKKNDISYEDLKNSMSRVDDNVLEGKLNDIAYIYNKFNQYMSNRYLDEEDKFNSIIEKIDGSRFIKNSEIWIDGFSGFTVQEYRIIEKLIKNTTRLNMTLTIDKDSYSTDKHIFYTTSNTYDNLNNIANRNDIDISETILDNNYNNKKEDLAHLERQLYSYPYQRYKTEPKNIRLFAATNKYIEVENVAVEIIQLVRDKGYRWKDIAVVTASIEDYALDIKRVLSEYEIPYFIDEKRSIMNNQLIKFILSFLRIIQRNFRYEDVFRFLKTGLGSLDKDSYEKLENYVLKYGIKGDSWLRDFEYGEEEELVELNSMRKIFVDKIVKTKKKLKAKKKVAEITKILFYLLNEYKIEDKLNERIEQMRSEKNYEFVNENTQIWNIIMDIFDQLVEILGDTKVTLKEYIEILESGFSEYKVGIIPPTIDQILVGNLERSKSHQIKALFIIGVNDGVLPSNIDDSGLLLDKEKDKMCESGIKLLFNSQTQIDEERFSIYTSFSKPREYLVVSYTLSDEEGRALRPSILVDRIKNIFPQISTSSDLSRRIQSKMDYITKPTASFKYLVENMREYVDGDLDEKTWQSFWADIYKWYLSHDEWSDKIQSVKNGLFHSNRESYIEKEKARELYELPLRSSISRLEKFANCPFAHLINYGLRPRVRKEYKIEIPDIGLLFHDFIEKYSKELYIRNLKWKNIEKDQSEKIVNYVIDKIIPDYYNNIFNSSYKNKYLVKRLKRVTKRAIWTLTSHVKRGEFQPFAYELPFGSGVNNIPPLILEFADGEKIELEGRIDRIDTFQKDKESYVKVIDYKSGSKKFALSDAYYGIQIQLLVYLEVLLQNTKIFKKDKIYPAGAFYFRIDDPIVNTDSTKKDEIEKQIMKELKMDGVLIKDISIIKALDKNIEKDRSSLIIPARLNKGGKLSKTSSALENIELQQVTKYVTKKIRESANEIIEGNVKIEPCKLGQYNPCQYCEYISICQFDTSFDGNSYKILKKMNDDEVLKRIQSEIEEKEE